MGDEVQVQGAQRRNSGACEGSGARNVRGLRDQDSERGGEQRPRAYIGKLPADDGTERNHETHQRTHVEQVARRVSDNEETVLGAAFLGEGLLLCNGRANDRRNDQTVFGTPL